jgi:ribose transport system ATP-binding protein
VEVDEHEAPPALTVHHVSKTFPGTRALVDVDFEIRPGEVHALVGQNGSGKSTFIKILSGFHVPDGTAHPHHLPFHQAEPVDGDVYHATVRGEPFKLGDPHAADEAGLRFVHQDLGLVSSLSTVDNLALGYGYITGAGRHIKWREQVRAARKAIKSLGYHFDVRVPVGHLSPVEKTAVAIAHALQGIDGGVSLLVLDEPTAAMPGPEVERLFRLIGRLKGMGIAVLYVTHHLEEVLAIADRVSVFRDGRRVATAQVRDTTMRQLVELMTGGWVDTPQVDVRPETGEPVLVAQGISGRALRSFDLTVCTGEVVGIAGITGSGRDELCNLLFGGAKRDGELRIATRLVEPMSPDVSVARGIALVPAERHTEGLVLTMSVRENLTLPDLSAFWSHFRLHQGTERKEARRWIKDLGVKTRSSEALVETLSGGNQQKVVLGKWLRLKPKVLLMDEPTQGVDVAAKAEIHGLIDQIAAEGTAVIVCSSDEAELERLSSRVLVLRRGSIAVELHQPDATAARIAQESLGAEHASGAAV